MNRNTRQKQMSGIVKYKFVTYKMKKIIQDSRGKYVYIESFDNVIQDIFGYKHLCKKIDDCYDDRDIINVIDDVGLSYLMTIMNTPKMYDALTEMVAINYRITRLAKELRRQSKKGKRKKDDVKEYNYLSNLYKSACKVVRKKLGIKNIRTSYKRKFSSLNDMVNGNKYGYDDYDEDDGYFSSLSAFNDYDYFDDYDDEDDEDDYMETSELDDFVNMMNGTSRKKPVNQRRKQKNQYDYFDEDDDDEDDEYENPIKMKDPRIDQLTDVVNDLSASVQSLVNKAEVDTTRAKAHFTPKTPLQYGYVPAQNQPSDSQILSNFVEKLSNEQIEMKRENKVRDKQVADAINSLASQQNQILDFLKDVTDDDEDDDYDYIHGPEYNEQSQMKNPVFDKYPDMYEDTSIPVASTTGRKSPTREELIDEINRSADVVAEEASKLEIVSEEV